MFELVKIGWVKNLEFSVRLRILIFLFNSVDLLFVSILWIMILVLYVVDIDFGMLYLWMLLNVEKLMLYLFGFFFGFGVIGLNVLLELRSCGNVMCLCCVVRVWILICLWWSVVFLLVFLVRLIFMRLSRS